MVADRRIRDSVLCFHLDNFSFVLSLYSLVHVCLPVMFAGSALLPRTAISFLFRTVPKLCWYVNLLHCILCDRVSYC
ncbi:hypothetical protein SCLCIDRAFT_298136 [Scleroderma citrinum Foug A]|uniref:Uncharacterized protein n=1 Tax=Scleroderma citrinum Foug A TaxID=1036808 RepID=A0A0C3DGB9_9AGAM|nr:hypothetical protein SCLCIDRAFT_298136 [Scleroderma citrinum Foug A]